MQRWDLVVDLGRSSAATVQAWEKSLECPIVRLDSFRQIIDDPRRAGEILRAGWGRVVDEEGVDWWELTSLLVHAELETIVALQRMVPTLPLSTGLFATRRG